MENIFNNYKINLSKEKQEKFEKYYCLLREYNEKFNITAIIEREEVYKKHFIDSLLGVDKINGETLIDIGSGGGFPAIPLKIYFDNLKVTLVEATGKKCEFLKTVVKELDLKNVTVINGRAEELAFDKNFREQFEVCTARAVARMNTLSEYCLPFVKVGGTFVAFKGDAKEEVEEAKSAFKALGGELNELFEYELDGAKRALVTVKKVANTDKKYPRGHGKERKNPL